MKIFLISLLTLVSLLSSKTWADSEIIIALDWKPEPQFGGFYAADFKELKVKLQEGGSGTPTIQMLAAKKVNYAVVSAGEILLAHERGATDIVAVFATYQTAPQAIMTHAERGFKSIEDVFKNEGTLLWQAGLPYTLLAQKKYGPFKVKTAPYTGGIGHFQNDKKISQQCFFTSEPLLAEAAGLKVKSFLIADMGYNPYTTVLAVRRSFYDSNPEEVKKVVASLRTGLQRYMKDPKPTNLKMAALNRAMSAETFSKSAEAQKPLLGDGSGSMTTQRWQELADLFVDLKLIKKKPQVQSLFISL